MTQAQSPSQTGVAGSASSPPDACWSSIGVEGDRSCPRLAQAVHCRNCPVFSEAGSALFQRESPEEYLQQWTRQLAEVATDEVGDAASYLLFRVGAEWLALEARHVVEVISVRPIHRVPHRTDRLLLGLANIRGELQLCVSVRELLGIEATDEAPGQSDEDSAARLDVGRGVRRMPRMIVVQLEQNRWVFPVDEVEGVHRISAAVMEELPYTVQKSPRYYCGAVFLRDEKRFGVLSVERLLDAMEKIGR